MNNNTPNTSNEKTNNTPNTLNDMNNETKTSNVAKTKVYNLIILDESGSMWGVTNATISGCNETLASIRVTQKNYPDQVQFVSIFVFQSSGDRPSRYLVKNMPIAEVADITSADYEPCGCTPLYDAIGSTIVDLRNITKGDRAIGNVTIITDGYENSSRHYNHQKVVQLIDAVKELGWAVNFIGANIDVTATAAALHIDSALEFQQDEAGTRAMFERERSARRNWNGRLVNCFACASSESLDSEEMKEKLRDLNKDYFDI